MKRLYFLLLVFILSSNLYGQTDTAYILTYGGIQNDVCNQIKPTYDGGYIMIGTTNSFGCGNTSFYAVKIDSVGKHLWSRTYGGPMNQEGYSVTTTFDHGYAFVGLTDSYGAGGYDVYLVKTDSLGNEQWEKTFGGSDWDFGYSIQQLPDSGFVICGQTFSYGAGNGDVYVIRTNSVGDTVWTRAIGGAGYDIGNSICVVKDTLYAIVGNTTSFGLGDTNVYFILIDSRGTILKDTTYGCTHSNFGNSIRETLDHSFVIFGNTDSIEPGKQDEMLVKIDSIGDLEWEQVYHSPGYCLGHDAMQVIDQTFIAVSTSNSYGYGGYAMRIWHIYSNGIPFFGPSLGGTADEQGNSLTIGNNGNVVCGGASDSPGFTEGLYDNMIVRWNNDDSIKDNRINFVRNFHDTSFCLPTYVAANTTIIPGVKVFPNPVAYSTTILIQGTIGEHYVYSLYNASGESIVLRMPVKLYEHGQSIVHVEKGNLADGIYVYQIQNQYGLVVASGKIIME